MKFIKAIFIITITTSFMLNESLFAIRNPVLPPAYLKDLNIEIKKCSDEEAAKAMNFLGTKRLIALKSLKNGGYIAVSDDRGKKTATTTHQEGSARFLTYTYKTPSETHFYAKKDSGKTSSIHLTCPEMEGNALAADSNGITFKKYDQNDETQEWIIESADGLDQVYFKNASTNKYLGLDGDGNLICQATESSKHELFKVGILD